jgi:hypothetical protein
MELNSRQQPLLEVNIVEYGIRPEAASVIVCNV